MPLHLPVLGSAPPRAVSPLRPAVPSREAPAIERVGPRAVRISITDRCDLACIYCRPHRRDGYLPAERRIDARYWATLVEGLARRGVTRVRITGGEPLVHPDVVEIVRAVARVPGVDDVALTTNATLLSELAAPLRDAGLARVNVSIDSLDPIRFSRFTRGGRLDVVLAGVEAARAAGFEELKTNTVVVGPHEDPHEHDGDDLRNDDELVAITRWAWSIGATPRFLERMKVGEGARLRHRIVSYAAMRARLAELLVDGVATRDEARGPAVYVDAREPGRRIGFITGSTETFCDGCDRLRATSDGRLRPCLATNDAVDVSSAIRDGDLEGIATGLDEAWKMKPDGVVWKGCTEETAAAVDMRATGG